jgi:glycosyltransferase involved in cell wall biosynthesis
MKENMSHPIISVLLPVYNGSAYLQATLDSISSQTLKMFELIVVDDGSSDTSSDILAKWKENQDFPVQHLRKPLNFGVCAALIDASTLARGKYVAQIGQDDVWLPSHLETLEAAMETHPGASAVFSRVAYVNGQSERIDAAVFNHDWVANALPEQLFARLMSGNLLCAPASMFRRDFFDISYWGVSNERLQDFELWLNLLMHDRFVVSDKTTCLYRLHDNNLSSGAQMRLQSEYEILMTYTRVLMCDRFATFYRNIGNVDRRLAFAKSLDNNLHKVTEYCAGIAILHSAVLERLSLWETERPQEITAMRIKVVRSLGLFRKALALRKTCSTHLLTDNTGLPFLVPAHDELPSIAQALIDEGCFQDGGHIDFATAKLPYIYVCAESQVDSLMGYESFARASRELRVIVVDAKQPGAHQYGFGITQEQHLDHALMDKLLRFVEETHHSFYVGRPMIGRRAP